MRNILSAFQNLMSLKQAGSQTEPEPRTGKNRFFFGEPEPNLNRLNLRSLILNRTRTFKFWCNYTRTEPEPKFLKSREPEPELNL